MKCLGYTWPWQTAWHHLLEINSTHPKNPHPSKVAILRTYTPPRHTGSLTPLLEGPMILRVADHQGPIFKEGQLLKKNKLVGVLNP